MTYLKTNELRFRNELSDEIRLFINEVKIPLTEEIADSGFTVCHYFYAENGTWYNSCELYEDGEIVSEHTEECGAVAEENVLENKKIRVRYAKLSVFGCLSAYFGIDKKWGALTGIRPTKLYRQTSNRSGEKAAERLFINDFFVSKEKFSLVRSICETQAQYISGIDLKKDIDIYIGIPFCVTRCSYCSFSSGLTTKDGLAEERYVTALLREIELTRDMIFGRNVRCVYIGGGTPTSLCEELLEKVVNSAAGFNAREFTVEAGRPDTITENKLKILRASGVSRISINAQTTSDATLERIGRAHTASEFFAAFEMARRAGFDDINTDLIIGLPGEGKGEFMRSLKDVASLLPENLTIHTLAIKRASKFGMENEKGFMSGDDAEAAIESSRELTSIAGYRPYYMYRQKYMTGNLENTGFSLPGRECVYNIDIMEETVPIVAYGAGAISKNVKAEPYRIERSPNVKNIEQYTERVDQMAERKTALFTAD